MSNILRVVKHASLVAVATVLLACGGSSGDIATDEHAGVYRMSYSRSVSGSVLVSIGSGGVVLVQVYDGADSYDGGGQLDTFGYFSFNLQSGVKSVTVSGQAVGNGVGSSVALAINGQFSTSGTANFVKRDLGQSFAGDYAGSYNGGASGSFTLHVSADGIATITPTIGGTAYSGSQSINGFQSVIVVDIPPGTGTFQTYFSLPDGVTRRASGVWSTSISGVNLNGTFTGDAFP